MAKSDVDVCNLALARVGVTAFIQDLEEKTKQARVCNQIFDDVRDLVLADFDWQFAEKRVALAETTNPTDDWAYAYGIPADMVKPRGLTYGTRNLPVEKRTAYRIIGNVLVSDLSPATLVYTERVEDAQRYTPHFVDALAWRLAGELIPALQVKTGVKTMEMYQQAKATAAAIDLMSQQNDPVPDAEHIRARE